MGTLSKIMSSQGETLTAQMEELTGEEIIAVGHLRQGRKPSMTAMVTGTALLELMRPRRSKALPRQFVLALTPTRAVAYGCIGVADDDDGTNYRVVVRGKERGSWPREAVGFAGEPLDGTLTVAGESFPVCPPNSGVDEETAGLLAALRD
jgi:hypothetical protein